MTGRVVVIGDALIDEMRDDAGVREFVGGAALNVAVGLGRLGVPATLIAMVGEDEPGERIESYLATFGVELLATPSPLGTARAVSTRSEGGEPTYSFNEASQRRRIRYGAAEHAAVADAALVAISCIALDDEEQTRELAETLASTGARFAIDPNPRAGMLRDREEFVRGFESIAPTAALVKIGGDDVDMLYGEPLEEVSHRLLGLGAGAVLATYGAEGAAIQVGHESVHQPIAELAGEVVDTMGAGDAAFASTLASMLAGLPAGAEQWREVLRQAMETAAATCRFPGALLRLSSALDGAEIDRIQT